MRKEKKTPKDKEQKKHLSWRRSLSNSLFGLRMILRTTPTFLIFYLVTAAFSGLVGFYTDSYTLRHVVDLATEGAPISRAVIYLVIVFSCSLATGLVWDILWWIFHPPVTRRLSAAINRPLLEKALSLDYACYERPEFYDKYVRAMDSAYDRVTKLMYRSYDLIYEIVVLATNSALLVLIDPILVAFALLPLLIGLLQRYIKKLGYLKSVEEKPAKRHREYIRRTFYLSDYAKEMRIGGIHLCMLRDFKRACQETYDIAKKYGIRIAVVDFIHDVGLEVLIVMGAMVYAIWSALYLGEANGGMSIGDCIVVLNSFSVLSYGLSYIVTILSDFSESALYIEDMRTFMEQEPAIAENPEGRIAAAGDIELHGVSFRYEGAEEDTLHDVRLKICRGERIAIVGRNGAGKTTLVKLLLRFYDPTAGVITLDGIPLADYRLSSWRGSFDTVFQDFHVFALSAAENVLLHDEREGDRDLVTRAMQESGIYERIAASPGGIDSQLTREFDDEGLVLSVGERQKLALARIFVNDAPFIILDEPSSALDPIAEHRMFENMMRATEGRSVVFISHRLSSATLADRVYMMEDGRVIESGTHAELMAVNGEYAEMFRCQADHYLGGEEADT